MSDLSATRKINSITTINSSYWVGEQYSPADGYYEKITTTKKSGDMAYIIWYQLWHKGQVIKEINSLHVVEVEYNMILDGDIPF